MKRTLALVAALSFCLLVLGAGAASATHKDGHEKPPACEKSQGSAADKNKHCYPPAAGAVTSTGNGSSLAITKPQGPKQGSGVTIGMAAMGAVGMLGASLLLRWRWVSRSPRQPR
jgi:hypothetical protein